MYSILQLMTAVLNLKHVFKQEKDCVCFFYNLYIKIYVVVNFLPQVISVFLLFWVWYCMLMKVKQKKNKKYLRQKFNFNIYTMRARFDLRILKN